MKNSTKAFSLIELLVVISIVGVLAAIASPLIKQYILRARLATVVKPIDDILDRMIAYANKNGVFPNAVQVGLPIDPNAAGNPVAADPAAVSEYLESLEIQDAGDGAGPCGAHGFVLGNFNTSALGVEGYLGFMCNLFHYNSTIKKSCYSFGGDGANSYTGLIPGWISYYSNANYGADDYYNNHYTVNTSLQTCM